VLGYFISIRPDVSSLTDEQKKKGLKELQLFIEKCYNYWVQYRKCVNLPTSFILSDESKEDFISKCRNEICTHLEGRESEVKSEQEVFRRMCEQAKQDVQNSFDVNESFLPDRSCKTTVEDSVKYYYTNLSVELPLLFFLFSLFRVCSASEAEVERYFSDEALPHNYLRNRLKEDKV